MTPESEGFRVTDRRHRGEGAGLEGTVPEPGASGRQEAEPGAGGRPRDPKAGRAEPRGPASVSGARPPRGGQRPGVDLATLFMMLASSALVALGEAPDPATGERAREPERAREAIDLLLVLRDKTEGNRSPEESHLLENLLYDLQMRFLGLARPAG